MRAMAVPSGIQTTRPASTHLFALSSLIAPLSASIPSSLIEVTPSTDMMAAAVAIVLPSGDHAGPASGNHPSPSSVATARTPVPSTFATKMLDPNRSEEHTSELQSQSNLVCRLLL